MTTRESALRIAIGNASLAGYPQGGGHWMVRLQYLLGLRALGHDAWLLELIERSGDRSVDEERVGNFMARCRDHGLDEVAAPVFYSVPHAELALEHLEPVGWSKAQLFERVTSTDLLWNDCGGLPAPILAGFRRRVLLDLDPGHLQISGLDVDLGLDAHDAFLTVGLNMHRPSCGSPTLGRRWHPFAPFVHLPLWRVADEPAIDRPFTSVTHWTWGELWWRERVLSISKRDGMLPYLALPMRSERAFELAVQDPPDEDRRVLEAYGWNLTDPWVVAATPGRYQRYIASSRAEISCPKPIFAELRTGWFSDRSACYLAAGRPVLARDTGFSDHVPVGDGLLPFETLDEAVEGVKEIDGNYGRHARAARALAQDFFDGRLWLPRMIEASFSSVPSRLPS